MIRLEVRIKNKFYGLREINQNYDSRKMNNQNGIELFSQPHQWLAIGSWQIATTNERTNQAN